jgi:hypothetical protein
MEWSKAQFLNSKTKFLKTKNLENLNNVYVSVTSLNKEAKLMFGRKLRNQLISVIDDEKDKPVELRFVMCMCQMLSGETLFLANKTDMYKMFLDILLVCMESQDFRHVVLSFGLKLDLLQMEKIIRTKYENENTKDSQILDRISKILSI